MSLRVPKYRKHTLRDKAFVVIDGKRVYLPGRYNSSESKAAYRSHLGKIRADYARKNRLAADPAQQTLGDLANAYLDHALLKFGDDRRSSFQEYKRAVRYVTSDHGLGLWRLYAVEFGPRQLKDLQQHLVDSGLARTSINGIVGKVRTWIKWCVSEELCDASVLAALQSVQGLERGRTEAAEPAPREPVEWRDVQPVFRHLQPTTRDMLWLCWYSGARARSICQAKPEQFECLEHVTLWRPRHKTEYRGKEVVLPLGPRCIAHIRSYLDREPDAYCFTPKAGRNASNRRFRDHYDPDTFRRAVQRAQKVAQDEARERGRYVPQSWSPHQLRHARATMVRNAYGVEAAAAVLGHSQINVTELYSRRSLDLAVRVATEKG